MAAPGPTVITNAVHLNVISALSALHFQFSITPKDDPAYPGLMVHKCRLERHLAKFAKLQKKISGRSQKAQENAEEVFWLGVKCREMTCKERALVAGVVLLAFVVAVPTAVVAGGVVCGLLIPFVAVAIPVQGAKKIHAEVADRCKDVKVRMEAKKVGRAHAAERKVRPDNDSGIATSFL